MKAILTCDGIYKTISLILAVFWFILAVPPTLFRLYGGGDDSLLNIYHKFAYRNETERLKIIAYDIFSTIAICKASVPENAKLLIASFPYDKSFRIEYYLYPRLIYWYEQGAKDPSTLIEFCKKMDIFYCITYDAAKKPILMKVKI